MDKSSIGRRSGQRHRKGIIAAAAVEVLEQRQLLSAASLDTTFGTAGKTITDMGGSDLASAVAILPSGKVLTAGTDGNSFALAQYTASGALDKTFGSAGKVATRFSPAGSSLHDAAHAIAVLSNGKFLVAGQGNGDFALARYNANGTLDTTFGAAHTGKVTADFFGLTGDSAYAISVQTDGKIVLAGSAQTASGIYDVGVARYTAAGLPDATFGTAHNGKIAFSYRGHGDYGIGIHAFANGKIVVGATVTNQASNGSAGDQDFALIRYNADGTLDTTFSPGGADGSGVATTDFALSAGASRTSDTAEAMLVTCGNRMVLAGSVDRGSATVHNLDFAAARFRYDGTLDTTFGTLASSSGTARTGRVTADLGSPNDLALAVASTPTNGLIIAGDAIVGSGAAANYDFAALSLKSNGTPDTTFNAGHAWLTTNMATAAGIGTPDGAAAVAVRSNGRFILAGVANGNFGLAQYLGTAPTGDGNNHLCAGVPVTIGSSTPASGAIDSPQDVDFYAITATAGQTIGFNIDTPAGSSLDSYIRLFDDQGNQLAFNDNGAASGELLGKSSYLSYTFAAGGTYYLGVSGAGNVSYDPVNDDGLLNGSTGAYTLSIAQVKSSDSGSTISTSRSVSIGSSIAESISISTDIDLYAFTVSTGETIGFNVDLVTGSSLDSYLRLFNSSGVQIAFNNDGAAPGEILGKSSYLSYTFTIGGTYYIGISGNGNISYNILTGGGATAGSVGGYSLTLLNLTSSDTGGTISTSRSIVIGSTTIDSISTSTDVDVYSISVSAGQTVGFDIDLAAGSALDSYIRLFNTSGTQIAFNNDGAAPGETLGKASYLSYTFTTGGTYYIGVSGNGNISYNVITGGGTAAGSTGGYSLVVNNLTPAGDPDDQISEAHFLTVGSIATDAISNSTDVDMFTFSVPAGATVQFDVDQTAGSSLDSYLRLFNAAGTQLAFNDNAAAPGETLGTSAYLSYTFTTAGTYYIAVSGAPNKSYDAITGNGDVAGSTGGYSLTVQVPSTGDPDDRIATARPIAINSSISDTISTSTDVDAYSFTATAGTLVGINIDTPAGGTLDSYLELVNSSGQYVAYSYNNAAPTENITKDSYIEFMIPTTGTWYAFVSGEPNDNFNPLTGGGKVPGASGPYTISLTNLSTQDPDDTLVDAHPISIGSVTSGTIATTIDVNVYRFTASAGQTISFDIDTPPGSSLDSYLEVTDSNGNYIAYSYNNPAPDENISKDSYIEYTFKTTGTYYVAVAAEPNDNFNLLTGGNDHAGTAGTKGPYTLTLLDVGAQDPNDQLSEAPLVSTNTVINSAITNPNDVNVYKFTVSAGQRVTFNIDTPGSSALDSYLEVTDANGNYLAYSYNNPAPGEPYTKDSYIDHTFAAAGTYYVVVSSEPNDNYNLLTGGNDHAGTAGTQGAYTLRITTL